MDGIKIYTSIVVTNVIRAGSAFALRADTGEQCFVPASIAESLGLVAGTEVEALLLPNMAEDKREQTPWFTSHVDIASIVRPLMQVDVARQQPIVVPTSDPRWVQEASVDDEVTASEASCHEVTAKPEEKSGPEVQHDWEWNCQTDKEQRRVKEEVQKRLLVDGGVWSHGQLIESAWGHSGKPPKWLRNCVGRTLRRMHRDGLIARWAFYRSGEQERASRDYWCATPDRVALVFEAELDGGA